MQGFNNDLTRRLGELRERGLYRRLRELSSPQAVRVNVDGRWVVNFSSNDYLGLASDPSLRQAACHAVEEYGAGSGASRLTCGTLTPHRELETALARFKGMEAALAFSSGYAAAVGTLSALIEKNDIVVIDKLAHASLIDGARLSGAKMRVFAHNDLADLERILRWTAKQRAESGKESRVLVVTESLFSMDGDQAPLREIVGLKNKYEAWLMVDEAHATGLYGSNRRGLAECWGVQGEIEVQMGTLSKSLGSVGGFVVGSRSLIDFLVNRSRSLIFSTAMSPSSAAAGRAGIEFVQSEMGAERCKALWERVDQFLAGLADGRLKRADRAGNSMPGSKTNEPCRSAIVPLIVGDETLAVRAAEELLARGILVSAIRYPAVSRGEARLRVTLSAGHTGEQVEQLLRALLTLDI